MIRATWAVRSTALVCWRCVSATRTWTPRTATTASSNPRCSPPSGRGNNVLREETIGNLDRIAVPYWRRGCPGL